MNQFSSKSMEKIVNQGFARVQNYSADWHASNFAGATVRKVSRAMWGFDAVTDALILMLLPTIIVLVGLSVTIGLRWPLAGLFVAVVVGGFVTFQLIMARHYIRPVNLASNALDTKIGGALADSDLVQRHGQGLRRRGARGSAVRRSSTERLAQGDQHAPGTGSPTSGWARTCSWWCLQAGLTGLLIWQWSAGQGDRRRRRLRHHRLHADERLPAQHRRQHPHGPAARPGRHARTWPLRARRRSCWTRRTPRRSAAELGEIVFDRVTFRYKPADDALYDGFTLRIAPGERVALVGPTGSGKSTFVKLVQRLYDLQGGRILIDGQDVANVTQGSLRRAIAVVPQDPALFHRTHRREHQLRAGPTPRRTRSRWPPGGRGPHDFIATPAQGLRHPGRRARGEAVGRRAAAGGHRPRLPGRRADPGAGRGHLVAGRGDRAPGAGGDGGADGRAAPPSSSPTACRPSAAPTASWSSRTAAIVEEGRHAELVAEAASMPGSTRSLKA